MQWNLIKDKKPEYGTLCAIIANDENTVSGNFHGYDSTGEYGAFYVDVMGSLKLLCSRYWMALDEIPPPEDLQIKQTMKDLSYGWTTQRIKCTSAFRRGE